MVRTRISTPERPKRSSGPPPHNYKPWKIQSDRQKRHSAQVAVNRPHGRKQPSRNFGSTETPPPKRVAQSADHYRFDQDDVTFYDSEPEDAFESDDQQDDDDDDENTLFIWEEESTLFSDLLDVSSKEPDDSYDSLVEALQPAFDERGRELKREIAETLVPTVNRVKGLYEQISTDVDDTFGKGIIVFNNACKELEVLAMRDEDDFKDAWAQLQRTNKELLGQLREAYVARQKLWLNFEKALKETVEPTLEALRALPANVERTIGNLEKQARQLEKDDANAVNAAEKKIKALLAK